MKKIAVCSLLFLLLLEFPVLFRGLLHAHEQEKDEFLEVRKPVNDGPYVFRKENQILVYFVLNDKKETTAYKLKMRGPHYISREFTVNIQPFKRKYTIPTAPPTPEPADYKKIDKIFVVSDIHGQFERFKTILINNNVMDNNLRWRWGKGHLVILGDVFDRGPNVTETLWTIYQLEQQAKDKGGRVHYLLGNHEIMVLKGDLRFVHPKYIYVSEQILETPITVLYGTDSVLGQWLRTKQTIIRINDILFVHAGIHPEILARNMDLNKINNTIRANLDTPMDAIKTDELLDFLFYTNGPQWYRGFFPDEKDYQQLEGMEIQRILDYFNVKHIIVGHTTLDQITPLFGQAILAVDSGLQYGDRGDALLWEKGKFYKATVTGKPAEL
jgi:hypothetical protein